MLALRSSNSHTAPRINLFTPGILLCRGVSECTRHITHGRTRPIGNHVGYLRCMQTAMSLKHVLDHFFAATTFDIDIDVGWPVTFGRQETFKQQTERHGIGFGDAQGVTHRAVGRTATTLTQNALLFTEAHDVPHHQEIPSKTECFDDGKFVLNGVPRTRTQREIFPIIRLYAVTMLCAFRDKSPKKLHFVQPVRARKRRQLRCHQ
ncbi:unannotated protein [freshwater metagenome]|uniref:Unannotated protein n=1 Tax=freshwater metagenome TaxID=449393 RepID=A0A6J6I7C8_9ZZZZ